MSRIRFWFYELVHLHDDGITTDNFRALMDKFMPKWRVGRDPAKE
jgi:hypothetical protein